MLHAQIVELWDISLPNYFSFFFLNFKLLNFPCDGACRHTPRDDLEFGLRCVRARLGARGQSAPLRVARAETRCIHSRAAGGG